MRNQLTNLQGRPNIVINLTCNIKMMRMQAFYVVHPTALLKYWIFMLRLALPEIYGRVTYVSRLADLQGLLAGEEIEVPQHVEDYDRSLQQS